MTEAERQTRAYAEVRARLMGAGQKTNFRQVRLLEERALERAEREAAEHRDRAEREEAIKNFSLNGTARASSSVSYACDEVRFQKPTMESIALAVLQNFPTVSLSDIKGHCRSRLFVAVRREVVAAIRKIRPDVSTTMLGRFLNKDHTTIMHAIHRYEEERAKMAIKQLHG